MPKDIMYNYTDRDHALIAINNLIEYAVDRRRTYRVTPILHGLIRTETFTITMLQIARQSMLARWDIQDNYEMNLRLAMIGILVTDH